MSYGICVNYAQHCPMFEHRVPAIEGDRCCECEQLLMHESGLTWRDAGEQYEPEPDEFALGLGEIDAGGE